MVYTRFGLIQTEELEDLAGRAVGDICGRFFNITGQPEPSRFDNRIVGIQLDDLRRGSFAVGVAGGWDKVAPLLAAIRGKFINVIITDEQTITSILALDETYPMS